MEFPDPYPDACISVERTVKVLKEDATRACHSINSFTGLPSLTMDDVREIWETLKSEGMQYGKVWNKKIIKILLSILDFIGEQRFFVSHVENQKWMERDGNDILVIDLENKNSIKGENSEDYQIPPKHFFICKYFLWTHIMSDFIALQPEREHPE